MTKQNTKSTRSKREAKRKPGSEAQALKSNGDIDRNEDDPNFGGLPERDLKKNLGCG